MGLKGLTKKKALDNVKKVAQGVQPTDGRKGNDVRRLPAKRSEAEKAALPEQNQVKEYRDVLLTGSKGQTYRVAVPASYFDHVPKIWKWTDDRYRVAELISEGIPISQIPDQPGVKVRTRLTIYAWLEHPEFKEYVDGIIMETGWASRRERLQNLQILNQRLLNKVLNEMDAMKLTDKNIGALLGAIQAGAKLIAQEKGEFIEESKVTQDTNITGTVATVSAKLEDLMASKTTEEIAELEKEFDKVGDDIIRAITGEKS